MCDNKCFLKLLGLNMAVVGPATIGLGIADIVLNYQWWCVSILSCGTLTTTLALTWVGVAIWASIPIILNGIATLRYASKSNGEKGYLSVLSFINTVAFAPAIVVITALELYFKFPGGLAAALPTGTSAEISSAFTAIFAIEITICIVGGVLFLHTFAVFFITGFCGNNMGPMASDPYNQPIQVYANKAFPRPGPQGPIPPAGFVNYGAGPGYQGAYNQGAARVAYGGYKAQVPVGPSYGYGPGAFRRW